MPYKCCIPGCKGNYKIGPKVAVFSFPSDDLLKQKWRRAIPRENFDVTKHSRVRLSFCVSAYFRTSLIVRDLLDAGGNNFSIHLHLLTLAPECFLFTCTETTRCLILAKCL